MQPASASSTTTKSLVLAEEARNKIDLITFLITFIYTVKYIKLLCYETKTKHSTAQQAIDNCNDCKKCGREPYTMYSTSNQAPLAEQINLQ